MNKNLNIAFRRRSSEQGFALPIAVGMGFVMILISATLLMRSQNDRAIASVQRDSAQSLLLSEVGVTRTLYLFKNITDLAENDYDPAASPSPVTEPWTTLLASISTSFFLGVSANDRWISVPGSAGHFKIVKYKHNTPIAGVGTLEVLGKTHRGAIYSLSVEISQSSLVINKWYREETP